MRTLFNRRSIAFRLICAVLAVEALSALLVILLSYGYERHAHFAAFDVMLRGRADSVFGAVQDSEDRQDTLIMSQSDLRLPREDVWQVSDEDGRVLGRSPNWSGPSADLHAAGRRGYLAFSGNHHHYAVLVLHMSRLVDPDGPDGGKLHHITIYYGAPTEHVRHAVRRAVGFYAAGSLLLLVVTGPLIAWLLHRGLSPLSELAGLASQVSANSWQFRAPESARSTPELASITLALESVLNRLEQAFTQQRVFVSDAAHELKTAVAVIKSSLQVLMLRPRNAEEYQQGLERCLADAERLESLVAQMLTLARVESVESEGDVREMCELAAPVADAVEHLATVARSRGVELQATLEAAGHAVVPLGRENCFVLISNLVLNAIQHSPADSRVEIRVERDANRARVSVRDHGEGIDPAVLPHVFDRFYRGDASRTRATGGTGLGLAICRAIVELAGGSIAIENCAGGGALATVLLPLCPIVP